MHEIYLAQNSIIIFFTTMRPWEDHLNILSFSFTICSMTITEFSLKIVAGFIKSGWEVPSSRHMSLQT